MTKTKLGGHGPDGGNLLGFLAAVGALKTLSRVWPDRDPQLHWELRGVWLPVWTIAGAVTESEVVDVLAEALADEQRPELTEIGDGLGQKAAAAFREFAKSAAERSSPSDRHTADVVAGLGIVVDDAFHETQLHMHNMGQLRFFRAVRQLIVQTEASHLQAALFEPWRYEDEGPTMRWDPVDDRRHAYRADDPAQSKVAPIRTVRGANRLAIEALPCLPVVPRARWSPAAGFRREGGQWEVRWPIWNRPAGAHTVCSLLRQPDVARADPQRAERLARLGVMEVFRSRRIDRGYRSFSPATALLGRT